MSEISGFSRLCYNPIMQEQRFLDVALAAVKKAEPVFLKYFGDANNITTKHDRFTSLVSDADGEVEDVIRKAISEQFPSHAIIGEEGAPVSGKHYTWYIDPIDGTTNFIRGFSPCAISIALWDREGPLIGVISAPQDDTTYYAMRGKGAYKNKKKISVSTTTSFDMTVGGLAGKGTDARVDLYRKALSVSRTIRILSSDAVQLAMVAEGKLDFFATNYTHPWDVSAGVLLVLEAGGNVTDWKGKSYTTASKQLVGSNGKIHSVLLSALKV